MSAPDAPTDTKLMGFTAIETSDPPSAPMLKKAKNQSRPTRRSSNQPPHSNAMPLPRMCGGLACKSGPVNRRYHSPLETTSLWLDAPNAIKVAILGVKPLPPGDTASMFSSVKMAMSTKRIDKVSHGTLNCASPRDVSLACNSLRARGVSPVASARATLRSVAITPIGTVNWLGIVKVRARRRLRRGAAPATFADVEWTLTAKGPIASQVAHLVQMPLSNFMPSGVTVRRGRP